MSIHHRARINAPLAKVYEAISRVDRIGAWWEEQTPTQTDLGLVLEHDPGPEHGVVKLRVIELVPNKRVEWECISTHPGSSPASAWTGTRFVFELAEADEDGASSGSGHGQGRTTLVEFHQAGYDERSDFSESNNLTWKQVLQNLKEVVEAQSR